MKNADLQAVLARARAGGSTPASSSQPSTVSAAQHARPTPTTTNDNDELLSRLLLDHLFLRQEMRLVADTLQIAVLYKDEKLATELHALRGTWVAQIPAAANDKKRTAPPLDEDAVMEDATRNKEKVTHPFGPKKQFLITAMLDNLKTLIDKSTDLNNKAELLAAVSTLQALDSDSLGNLFTGFCSKAPKPMAGRTWLWILTTSTFMPDNIRQACFLLATSTSTLGVAWEPKRSSQSRQEGDLWKTLKSRPKKSK